MTRRIGLRIRRRLRVTTLSCLLVLFSVPANLSAQATITPNYKDADIQQVIEAVGAVTGNNFIIDPRVKAQVTMISSSPMSSDAFYEAFLSILQVYGFVAVPAGDVIKILPDANARQLPGWEGAARENRRADDIVTQVVSVKNIAAAQLVPILRPLIPQYGHLAAHPASNMLIISDRAANVDRIMSIIRRIDQSSDEEYEVVRLEHASASETVRVISSLKQSNGSEGGKPTTVVADERTNSILVSGDKADRLRLRTLIAHLDTPLEFGGDTRVRYLRYAEAADLAGKLEGQYSGSDGATAEGPGGTEIKIWADEQTNALVITAPPKTMRNMMSVIDKIDIRRAQVLVEAIIVEINANNSFDLGVTWAALNDQTVVGFTELGTRVGVAALSGIGADSSGDRDLSGLASAQGATLGVGKSRPSGAAWVALIEALESNNDSNVMATPTLVTLDNEEAEINVGQEVPFTTGSFTGTGGGDGAVNPFQTVQREQVGLTLKITPQINEGNAVLLEVESELSSLTGAQGASGDFITNKRTVNTSVIVDDGSTLVIGGLTQEDLTEGTTRVPLLGRIPLLGRLFRADSKSLTKKNLMLFIRPTIMRDNVATAYETNSKYNVIRDIQQRQQRRDWSLLPTFDPKVLPELDDTAAPEAIIDLRGLTKEEAAAEEAAAEAAAEEARNAEPRSKVEQLTSEYNSFVDGE